MAGFADDDDGWEEGFDDDEFDDSGEDFIGSNYGRPGSHQGTAEEEDWGGWDSKPVPASPGPSSAKKPVVKKPKGKSLSTPAIFIIGGVLALVLGIAAIMGYNYLQKRSIESPGTATATSTGVPLTSAERDAQNTVTTQAPPPQAQGTAVSKVAEPVVESTFDADGAVTNKYVVKLNGQLVYTLDVTISREGKNRIFQYYTSKDIYDSMNIGTDLKVTYTGDAESNFILISMVKAD